MVNRTVVNETNILPQKLLQNSRLIVHTDRQTSKGPHIKVRVIWIWTYFLSSSFSHLSANMWAFISFAFLGSNFSSWMLLLLVSYWKILFKKKNLWSGFVSIKAEIIFFLFWVLIKKLARLQAILKYHHKLPRPRRSMSPPGNGPMVPILGFLTCVAFLYLSFGDLWLDYNREAELGFVSRNGTQFVLDGKPLYVNGWNSYWFMDHAVNDHSRHRVGAMLEAGSKMGLTVCRTWAFNDGGYNALQISPGRFDERVFKVPSFALHLRFPRRL